MIEKTQAATGSSGVGAQEPRPDPDGLIYRLASYTLRGGVLLSFGIMGLGLIWWVLMGAPGGRESASQVLPFDKLLPEAGAGNPLALMNIGVLLLLATPGVTLLAQIAGYLATRNMRFAAISGLVGIILLLSLALSLKWLRLF